MINLTKKRAPVSFERNGKRWVLTAEHVDDNADNRDADAMDLALAGYRHASEFTKLREELEQAHSALLRLTDNAIAREKGLATRNAELLRQVNDFRFARCRRHGGTGDISDCLLCTGEATHAAAAQPQQTPNQNPEHTCTLTALTRPCAACESLWPGASRAELALRRR